MTKNKEMGWGMNSSNMHTSKLDKYTVLNTAFNMIVKINSMFRSAVHIVSLSKHGLSYHG